MPRTYPVFPAFQSPSLVSRSFNLPVRLYFPKVQYNTYKMEIDGGPEVELFAQQTQEFLSWFRGLPGATFHESIQLEDLRGSSGAGRGIG